MRFSDGLATGDDLIKSAETAVRNAVDGLGAEPDLVCFFVCGEDAGTVEVAGEHALTAAGEATVIGCTATGVIGEGQGVELTPAVSAWAASLPDVRLTPYRLETLRSSDEEGLVVLGLPQPDPDDEVAVLLVDPYSFPVDAFVEQAGTALPGLPLIGGLANGVEGRGSVRLFSRSEEERAAIHQDGAIGVMLGGEVDVRTVVSQGCRPIGPNMVVTKAEGNMLLELAGRPALERLEEIVSELGEEERELVASGLHIGLAMDEYAERHERGDFLIRGVIGIEPEGAAVAIGDQVEVGRTVRFQVRDAVTAEEDLRELLTGPADGALLFSCNGRGAATFASADHDVRVVRELLSTEAVAGFFAAGEIGPVAGHSHVHGFTASVLAFGGSK